MSYGKIQTKEGYNLLKSTGMFYEFHSELTGNWEEDKEAILGNKKRFHCQADEEHEERCLTQCDHCKKYYKPLDEDN